MRVYGSTGPEPSGRGATTVRRQADAFSRWSMAMRSSGTRVRLRIALLVAGVIERGVLPNTEPALAGRSVGSGLPQSREGQPRRNLSVARFEVLESADLFRDGPFSGQALDAAGAEESRHPRT